MHGFALNVCTDLDYFSFIIPCGIQGGQRGVTSIAKELARETGAPEVTVKAVLQQAGPLFAEIFGYEHVENIPGEVVQERLK